MEIKTEYNMYGWQSFTLNLEFEKDAREAKQQIPETQSNEAVGASMFFGNCL